MAERVIEMTKGKTRDQPISPKLKSILESVGEELDVYFEVTSGGQAAKGSKGKRTGSTRHDHGEAADTKAYRLVDGEKEYLDFSTKSGRETWSEIVRFARSAGATGIGAGSDYMGTKTVHIGFGKEAVWGASGRNANAPDWLRTAFNKGKTTPPMNIPSVASALSVAPTPASRTGLDSARMAYAPEGSTESHQSSLISLLSRAPTPATPSPSLQASRAVQSFRDPRPSSGMPTLPISGRMGASAATAPSLVPPAMSGPTRSVRTEPVSADRFAGMPVNYYPQLPASRDTGTTRLAAPGAGLTPAQRSAMSAVPGAYASPKTPQEVAALYKGILPIAPQAPQAAPHVRSGMLSDEYTPPRQMASAPVPASIDERLRARDPMTAQVAPVPAPRPQSRMAPVPASMSPGMAVARAGLPKPVIGQDPFTMRPRTAAQDMYDSAFGAQPPIPATMSASLASSRSGYSPSAPTPASVFSREIARARTPSNNIIRAGDYAYTKGPQGYQKVSPNMVASTSGGGSSQVASWRDPNAASKGSWPF